MQVLLFLKRGVINKSFNLNRSTDPDILVGSEYGPSRPGSASLYSTQCGMDKFSGSPANNVRSGFRYFYRTRFSLGVGS